jgi:hypothetical protein
MPAPCGVSWQNLTVEENAKTLLHGVSGRVDAGETVCILGAPDSGAELLVVRFPPFHRVPLF